jgi:hypothetical protein
VAFQAAAAAEVDRAGLLHGADPLRRRRRQCAKQLVQPVTPGHLRAGHQQFRVGEVRRAALVHHHLSTGEHLGDVADPARVIQVDVGDDHCRQVGRAGAKASQRVPDNGSRRRGPGLHQAGPVRADQVASGDPVVAGHEGVDLVDIMTEVRDGLGPAGGRCCDIHAHIPADRAERCRPAPPASPAER